MYGHTHQNLQITRSDIRPHTKWTVSLMIAYGHFNILQGFVWVYMTSHTHFITPEGKKTELAGGLAFMKSERNIEFMNI